MQSILMAISDLIVAVFSKPEQQVKVEESTDKVPAGYRPLFFRCWLCDGITKFACKNSIKNKRFKIDCSRCGVENAVSVATKK